MTARDPHRWKFPVGMTANDSRSRYHFQIKPNVPIDLPTDHRTIL